MRDRTFHAFWRKYIALSANAEGQSKGGATSAALLHWPRISDMPYRIVGMTNSAPARMPVGQREVMVLRRV